MFPTTPIICLVTDRRRLNPERWGSPDSVSALLEQIRAAVAGGVDLAQIRERDLEAGALVGLVARAVALASSSSTRIIVNDRLDVALAAGAAGVHLRGDSFDAARARALVAPGFIVGRSVHSLTEAEAAERDGGLDYLIFGPVYRTRSKPGRVEPAGLDALRAVARAVALPVLAIGGIRADTVGAVARAGACGVAAIDAFVSPVDCADDHPAPRLRSRFDTGPRVV